MSLNIPSTTPYTASNREIYAWAFGGIALHLLITLYGQAMNILIVGLGMKAWIVSLAMMLPRMVDAVVDPFMGHFSDNIQTRWGRRKPFLVAGCLFATVFLFLIWCGNPGWSRTMQLVHLTGMGILFYLSWGLYSMSYTALGYELTDDYHERSRIASFQGLVTAAVLLVIGGVFWFTLRPLFHTGVAATVSDLFSQGLDFRHMGDVLRKAFKTVDGAPSNQINGIRWVTGVAIAICFLVVFNMVRTCRERFVMANAGSHSTLGVALAATIRNKPFVDLMVYRLCQVFGERVYQGLLFYIGLAYVCGGDKSMIGRMLFVGGMLGSVITFLLLPFLKSFTIRLGKRAGLVIISAVALALLLAQPLILSPSHPYLLLIPLLLLPLMSVLSATLMNAILPDICDLDELEHGERREGLFTAVTAFMGKMEISLSLGIVGGILWMVGYNEASSAQAPELISKLLWSSISLGIFFTACALIAACRFNMNAAQVNEIHRLLEIRRSSGDVGNSAPTSDALSASNE